MAESKGKGPKRQEPLIQTHRLLHQPYQPKAERSYKSTLILWKATRLCSLTVLAVFICAGWTAAASTASNQSPTQINKFALSAYCIEAQKKSGLSTDGQVSYKRITELASYRALLDHPTIFNNPASWKTRIVAMLDQYGDEPTQLCREEPGP
jgi:hypothetical protein